MDISDEIRLSSLEFNSTFGYLNSTNNTIPEYETEYSNQSSVHKHFLDYLILSSTTLMLAAMGCTLTVKQLLKSIKQPTGICIGMFSQFVILPLTGFSITKIIAVDKLTAISVLLISCCPGGLASNVVTYYCDGDVSLSVTMTSASTLVGMGLMPLNLYIYGRSFATGSVLIPYSRLATALLMATSPVVVGVMIRWKWPRAARIIAKVGSFVSLLLVLSVDMLLVVCFPSMFFGGQSSMYAAVFILPFLGLTLGFVAAFVLGQTREACKTIAVESGFQNVPLAMGVVALSFPREQQVELLRIPVLYGVIILFFSVFCCAVYQAYKKCVSVEEKSQHTAERIYEGEDQEQIEITT